MSAGRKEKPSTRIPSTRTPAMKPGEQVPAPTQPGDEPGLAGSTSKVKGSTRKPGDEASCQMAPGVPGPRTPDERTVMAVDLSRLDRWSVMK